MYWRSIGLQCVILNSALVHVRYVVQSYTCSIWAVYHYSSGLHICIDASWQLSAYFREHIKIAKKSLVALD